MSEKFYSFDKIKKMIKKDQKQKLETKTIKQNEQHAQNKQKYTKNK